MFQARFARVGMYAPLDHDGSIVAGCLVLPLAIVTVTVAPLLVAMNRLRLAPSLSVRG